MEKQSFNRKKGKLTMKAENQKYLKAFQEVYGKGGKQEDALTLQALGSMLEFVDMSKDDKRKLEIMLHVADLCRLLEYVDTDSTPKEDWVHKTQELYAYVSDLLSHHDFNFKDFQI